MRNVETAIQSTGPACKHAECVRHQVVSMLKRTLPVADLSGGQGQAGLLVSSQSKRGAVGRFAAEVNLIGASFSGVPPAEFIKLRSHIYEMRLNWFAPPLYVLFRSFSLWRPKYLQLDPNCRAHALRSGTGGVRSRRGNALPLRWGRTSGRRSNTTDRHDMDESWSQDGGSPAESAPVQTNMQRQRSVAPTGPSPPTTGSPNASGSDAMAPPPPSC